MKTKNAGSQGAAVLSKIDFSNISVPPTCAVKATTQLNDTPKALEIATCGDNITQVADTEVSDVTFTSPAVTSTPQAKPTRSTSHVIRHPNRYGTSNVRVK